MTKKQKFNEHLDTLSLWSEVLMWAISNDVDSFLDLNSELKYTGYKIELLRKYWETKIMTKKQKRSSRKLMAQRKNNKLHTKAAGLRPGTTQSSVTRKT